MLRRVSKRCTDAMSKRLELGEKLYAEFSKAEGAVKEYEHLTGYCPVPSVNELRYAGCHAIQAIKMVLMKVINALSF